ncbi:protein kinase activating protein [Martiniozyma asiatica (nom. inval.)]|nr:protein kinase activating protein [Martiniozyma asiatica]
MDVFTTTGLNEEEVNKVIKLFPQLERDRALTKDVKFLFVGSDKSAKLTYALEKRRDIHLIDFQRIADASEWFQREGIKGLDRIPWPLFINKKFCLVRLGDGVHGKKYINALIEHFGGKCGSSLSESVDYVISIGTVGNRFEVATKWGIPVLHPVWIIDCINTLSILDINKYLIKQFQKNKIIKGRNDVDYGNENNFIYQNLKLKKKIVGLFKGFAFTCYGFDSYQVEKLKEIVVVNGGEFWDDYDESVSFVIVSSNIGNDIPPKLKQMATENDTKLVNEWFIERSLHYKKIIFDSWSIPRPYLHLKYKFKIHITGFPPLEHLHLTKLINLLGFNFSEILDESCNYLISNLPLLGLNTENAPQLFTYKYKDLLNCKSSNQNGQITKNKINSAKNWSIPVVSIAFLWEVSEKGILPDILNQEWCIFAPREAKPASNFLEYARSVSGGTFQTQKTSLVSTSAAVSKVSVEEEAEIEHAERNVSISDRDRATNNDDKDISQQNSPTKIHSFPPITVSPRKDKSQSKDFCVKGTRLQLSTWRTSENHQEEPDIAEDWWNEDADFKPIKKRRY